jgi:Regulator of ribonuclease activity B
MELLLVKNMLITYNDVAQFERELEERVSAHDGYLDGWGVMQAPI